tara:strand:- start:366 stop:695 length:330 start_codon:yes stop_codon:yes gene_type:complete
MIIPNPAQLKPIPVQLTEREIELIKSRLTPTQYRVFLMVLNNPGIPTGQLRPNSTQCIDQGVNKKLVRYGLVVKCDPLSGRINYYHWSVKRIGDVEILDVGEPSNDEVG